MRVEDRPAAGGGPAAADGPTASVRLLPPFLLSLPFAHGEAGRGVPGRARLRDGLGGAATWPEAVLACFADDAELVSGPPFPDGAASAAGGGSAGSCAST